MLSCQIHWASRETPATSNGHRSSFFGPATGSCQTFSVLGSLHPSIWRFRFSMNAREPGSSQRPSSPVARGTDLPFRRTRVDHFEPSSD